MNRAIIKQLYTEHNTHFGGVAKFGYIHLPIHHELYLVKEISQKFKVFNIPFPVKTQLDVFAVPIEIVSLMVEAIKEDGLDNLDIENYRAQSLKVAGEARKAILKNLESAEGFNDVQKENIKANVEADKEHTDTLFSGLTTIEKEQLETFIKNKYHLLYKVVNGVAITYYLARILDDRVSLYAVEMLKVKPSKYLLSNVRPFQLTKTYMETFINHIKEKGVDLV